MRLGCRGDSVGRHGAGVLGRGAARGALRWAWPNAGLPVQFLVSWSLEFFGLVFFLPSSFQLSLGFLLSLAQVMGHCAGFENEVEEGLKRIVCVHFSEWAGEVT